MGIVSGLRVLRLKGVIFPKMFRITHEEILVFGVVTILETSKSAQEKISVFDGEAHATLVDHREQVFEKEETQSGIDQFRLIDFFRLILLLLEVLKDVVEMIRLVQLVHQRTGKEVCGHVFGDHRHLLGQGFEIDEESRTHVSLHVHHRRLVVGFVALGQEVTIFLRR